MEKLINKLIHLGIRGFMDESKQKLAMEDEIYLNDSEDEEELEQRYMGLSIPREQRRLIDDYIACMKTVNKRYSDISYMAGVKDTVKIFVQLGMLKE